jgi:GT2 family glycosyltransferase
MRRSHAGADRTPIFLAEVELSNPLVGIRSSAGRSRPARVLVRLHSHPLGILRLSLPAAGLDAASLRTVIWEELSHQIRQHLAAESSKRVDQIPPEGFRITGREACTWRSQIGTLRPPAATIVINTCRWSEQLERTVASAQGQNYPNVEVVVVDNRPSTSGVRTQLSQRFKVPTVVYAAEPVPGLGRARNTGLRAATAEVVAFTDDDVLLDRSWLSWLVAGFSAAENVTCVTGLILPLELETEAQLLFEEFNGWSARVQPRVWDLDENRLDHPLYPYTVGVFGSGANAAFRRQALLELGGFDGHLGVGTPACGGEDLDVYTRIILSGSRIVYQPAAILRHAHPRDMRRLGRQARLYGAGLGAMLTKHLLLHSQTRRELLRRLPAGLAYTFSPRSLKNARKPHGYPFRLSLYEVAGLAWGPVGYIRSRLSA